MNIFSYGLCKLVIFLNWSICPVFIDCCFTASSWFTYRNGEVGINSRKNLKPVPKSAIRINAVGQRFTATHGISAEAGDQLLFAFIVDRSDVHYISITANQAVEGSQGGYEKYELYLKYGEFPTSTNYSQKSTLITSESYVGKQLLSRDLTIQKPLVGTYYILLVAKLDFHDLLITAIMDTPFGQS